MAVVTLYQPLDMSTIYSWYGDVTVATASQIRITDGYRMQDYYGSFQYDSYGLSGGYVTSTAAYAGNARVFEASDFNVNAVTLESYIDYDAQAALALVLSGNDEIRGSNGSDLLIGYAGNDRLYGNGGNDLFIADPGSDWIDGGAGLDVVYYASPARNYSVFNNGGFKVSDNAGNVDSLVSIERLVFADSKVLALDIGFGQHAGAAYRLYQAAFDRVPDREGLAFWVGQLDAGSTFFQVAQGFVQSPEFQRLNPDMSNDAILNNYYLNVLGRPADAEGLAYWSQQMANGMPASEALFWFSESAENMANTNPAIESGIWLV